MRLSDQSEYIAAKVAEGKGDLSGARRYLQAVLERARSKGDGWNVIALLQQLGDIEAKAGNLESAHSLHIEAIGLDRSSPLPVLLYAKSLLSVFQRPDLARSRAADAEALLASFESSEDEMPRDWYEREIHALTQEIARTEP
jgi:hypothetical protein